MPTNIAIATARRSASASPLYSLLPRAPPTRLRDPGVAARDDLREAHVKTSPAREPPFIMAGSSIRGCCGRRGATSAWVARRTAARGTDHAQHRDLTSHTISSRNRHSPTTCSGRTKLLHRQGRRGRQSSPRRRDFRTWATAPTTPARGCAAISRKRPSQAGPAGLPRAALPPACPAGPASPELEASADRASSSARRAGRGGPSGGGCSSTPTPRRGVVAVHRRVGLPPPARLAGPPVVPAGWVSRTPALLSQRHAFVFAGRSWTRLGRLLP